MLKTLSTVTTALSLVVLSASVGQAATFNLNRSIGSGSVTGTIDTDDTIGTLSQSNITNWNLLLNDGTGTFNLLGPLSGANSQLRIDGNSFSATATDLLFDFVSSNSDFVLFQNPNIGSGQNFWCIENAACSGAGTGEAVGLTIANTVASSQSGLTSIATITGGSQAVPEPFTIIGTAVGGTAALRMRKKLKNSSN
ncbi:PEP-CTERM sorting domain-containing protein [Chamaesiphon sp. OTE_75_metabat_556]|uniref:PEP-CTERM sorting domain-containing protein n=1 Tax=Chamaesiphon sp. OTE_75_metabat_556 TaxID=2964692 RepID=UPI00286B0551|nr:PEP-CTERM sorting domain-containing protein [Chamaesiphon sp. OTE_75_metabat_556]